MVWAVTKMVSSAYTKWLPKSHRMKLLGNTEAMSSPYFPPGKTVLHKSSYKKTKSKETNKQTCGQSDAVVPLSHSLSWVTHLVRHVWQKWPHEILGTCFLPPGFHAAIFVTVFFRVTHEGLSKRGTTSGLMQIDQIAVCELWHSTDKVLTLTLSALRLSP